MMFFQPRLGYLSVLHYIIIGLYSQKLKPAVQLLPYMESDNTDNRLEEQEEKLLNLYLQELLEKQENTLLTEDDIKNLEEKYPLSQEEKEKILMLSHRHILRAEQYQRQEKWDTAIVELERALLFTPLDHDLRLDLADLYIIRSREYGYLGKDLDRASNKIRETLTLNPGFKRAQKMQKELHGLKRILRGKNQNKMIIPLVIALMLLLGAVTFPRIRAFRFWNSPFEPEESSPSLPVQTDWTSRDLTVVQTERLTEKVALDVVEAEMQKSEDGYAISLSGYAQTNRAPLKELSLKLSIGDMLSPILTKEIPLFDESSPTLSFGETLPFSAYFKMTDYKSGTDAVNLQLASIKETEEEQPPWLPLTPFWEIPRPETLNLNFASREYQPLEGYDRMYFYQDIRLENNSMDGISELNITARWYDAEEQEIVSKEINFIPPGYPPIQRESVQTVRIFLDLPKSADPVPSSYVLYIDHIKKEDNHVPENP
jgi:tetratricopeptide (TPR) repeat protein